MGRTTSRLSGVVKLNLPFKVERVELAPLVFVPTYIVAIFLAAILAYGLFYEPEAIKEEVANLKEDQSAAMEASSDDILDVSLDEDDLLFDGDVARMLPAMADTYNQNNDTIGWLKIDDMVIDYPVMQTPECEEYYLNRDFEGNSNSAGCLIMDTDSTVGTGTKANNYQDGTAPSTNLIIHGHNMKNGSMFGDLDKFRKQDFEKKHSIIKFTSLYEEREYEIIAVFLSQVFKKTETNKFKYYKFFEATNEEEFNDFYKNIKKLQLYDTKVKAEFGDEFITLSVCAYHVENGRLVVVGKRIE